MLCVLSPAALHVALLYFRPRNVGLGGILSQRCFDLGEEGYGVGRPWSHCCSSSSGISFRETDSMRIADFPKSVSAILPTPDNTCIQIMYVPWALDPPNYVCRTSSLISHCLHHRWAFYSSEKIGKLLEHAQGAQDERY
jgi:hypothetical protein